jgi:hypothetical protein
MQESEEAGFSFSFLAALATGSFRAAGGFFSMFLYGIPLSVTPVTHES